MNLKLTDVIIILKADSNCLRTNVRYVVKSEKVFMGYLSLSNIVSNKNIFQKGRW